MGDAWPAGTNPLRIPPLATTPSRHAIMDVRVLVDKGRGNKLNAALVIVCGVAALVSSLLSFLYVPPYHLSGPLLTLLQINMAAIVSTLAARLRSPTK